MCGWCVAWGSVAPVLAAQPPEPAAALGAAGPQEDARQWAGQLTADDATVRAAAAAALLRLGPAAIAPLLDRFNAGTPADRAAIDALLPTFGPSALEALCVAGERDYGGSRYPDQYIMWNEAVRTASRMGKPAVPPLVAMLQGSDPGQALFAVLALGRLGDFVVEPVAALLGHPEAKVRQDAARVLGDLMSPAAKAVLLDGTTSADPDVRYYSARGLKELADRSLAGAFLKLLDDSAFTVREQAAAGLRRIYEPAYRLPLARMACCDPATLARDTATKVLMRTPDPMARRLGYRYQSLNISPAFATTVAAAYAVLYGITGLVLLGLGAMLTQPSRRAARASRRRVIGLLLAACGVGVVWGGVLQRVVREAELGFLWVVLPLLAGMGVLVGRSHRRFETVSVRWWLALIGATYAGYTVAWLWLWGYFGF